MMKRNKAGFTLVELIIVIAIIATLSVIAVMTITEWLGKSRDARRVADLGQIDKALDLAYTKNAEMPMPDSYVNVTASGTVIGYQGKFCDTAVAKTSIKTTPKDPMDDTCYSYYINADKNKFQIMGMLENDKKIAYESSRVIASNNLDQSKGVAILEEKIEPLTATRDINIGSGSSSETNLRNNSQGLLNSVFAADYSKRYPKVKGEKLGILISSGTNQPIEDGGAAVDVVNTTSSYVAYFNDTSKTAGTGLTLFSSIYVNSPAINTNTGFASFDSGLVAYYDMESVTSTGLLMDLSKYGYNGIINSTSISTSDGKKGKAYSFNGIDSYIDGGITTNLNFTTSDFSYNFWIKVNSLSSQMIPISKGTYQSNGWYTNIETGGTTRFIINVASNAYSVSSPAGTIQANNWYNIAGVKIGNTGKLYVNGVLVSTVTFSANPVTTTSNFIIGKYSASNANYLNGNIDEVRIYNRALSDYEIQSLYNISK